jgi:small redox-active disulfide protein 2
VIVRVLGTGCSKCNKLFKLANQAVRESGVEARVERVQDLQEILSYDILMTPGLVIDGAVKVAGRVPGLDELKSLLLAAKPAQSP